jgi:hypothetical protein
MRATLLTARNRHSMANRPCALARTLKVCLRTRKQPTIPMPTHSKTHSRKLLCSIKQNSIHHRPAISSYSKLATQFKIHRGPASAANTSGFVQTPQSKVPRDHSRAPLLLCLPGHFRLSHSVYQDLGAFLVGLVVISLLDRRG